MSMTAENTVESRADGVSPFKDDADERAHLLDMISTLHKNIHNVRPPSGMFINLSMDELRKAYAQYGVDNQAHMDEYKNEQAEVVASFEAEIAKSMSDHNIDRDTAIRWDVDAHGLKEDVEHYGLEYYGTDRGLPYGYFLTAGQS
jgi:hypothetical protein